MTYKPDVELFVLGTSASAGPGFEFCATAAPRASIADWPSDAEEQLKQNTREYPVTLALPTDVLKWIGTIVSYWALAEWIQAGTLCRLLNIGRKQARVMFGTRIGNSASKIAELIAMNDVRVDTDLTGLAKLLRACDESRNIVGHCVWMIDPDTQELCAQNPSGAWKPPQQKQISRRKYPQAFYPDEAWFSTTLDQIKSAIRQLQKLDQEIEAALQPSK